MSNEITGLNSLLAYLTDSKEVLRGDRPNKRKYRSKLWSSLGEYVVMFTLVGLYRPDLVLECGTANGASALSWAVAQELCGIPMEVHTFDPVKRPKVYDGVSQEKGIKFYQEDWIGDTSAKLLSTDRRKLIFIDGKHVFEDCLADARHSVQFLSRYDTLVFHDYTVAGGVIDTVDLLVKELGFQSTVIPSSAGIAVVVR